MTFGCFYETGFILVPGTFDNFLDLIIKEKFRHISAQDVPNDDLRQMQKYYTLALSHPIMNEFLIKYWGQK